MAAETVSTDDRMSRQQTLSDVWVEDEKQFGDLTVQRPSSYRLNVLMQRRNKWITDNSLRDQTDLDAGVEWLFVLSRTQQELTGYFRMPLEEWEEMIQGFMAELPDEVIQGFQEYFEGKMTQLNQSAVEDAEAEPGKPEAEEALSHAS